MSIHPRPVGGGARRSGKARSTAPKDLGEGPGHLEDPVDVLAALSVGERHMQGVVRCADSNHSGAVTCDEIGSHLIVPTVWFGPVRQAP